MSSSMLCATSASSGLSATSRPETFTKLLDRVGYRTESSGRCVVCIAPRTNGLRERLFGSCFRRTGGLNKMYSAHDRSARWRCDDDEQASNSLLQSVCCLPDPAWRGTCE